MALILGDSKSLKAVVLPVGAPQAVVWSTSDDSVLEVHPNGSIVTMGAGTADAIATTVNGLQASCKVTVKAPTLTGVKFNKDTKLARVGQKDLTLEVIPEPYEAEAYGGKWESTIKAVQVDQAGNINVVGPLDGPTGTAVITYTVGGFVASCTMSLLPASDDVPVTGIDPEGVSRLMPSGGVGLRLRSPIIPEDASDMRFEYTFEDPDGIVDLKAMGKGPWNTRDNLMLKSRTYNRHVKHPITIKAKPLGKPELGFVVCGVIEVEGDLKEE